MFCPTLKQFVKVHLTPNDYMTDPNPILYQVMNLNGGYWNGDPVVKVRSVGDNDEFAIRTLNLIPVELSPEAPDQMDYLDDEMFDFDEFD